VGRNPVEDIYSEENTPFVMNQATVIREGKDVLLTACGEMVKPAKDAADLLAEQGIEATVLDMYCVKPMDVTSILKYAENVKLVVTAEEHSPFGGLGSMVSQVIASECPKRVVNLALPDAPVITGTSKEVFDYYGLNAQGIAAAVMEKIKG
jgi:transketolase